MLSLETETEFSLNFCHVECIKNNLYNKSLYIFISVIINSLGSAVIFKGQFYSTQPKMYKAVPLPRVKGAQTL